MNRYGWLVLLLYSFVLSNFIACSSDDDVSDDDQTHETANTAPVVSLDSPASGTEVSLGAEVAFSGTVTDAEDDPQDMRISWSSSIDGVLNTSSADSQGRTQFSTTGLSLGEHTITLEATDTSEYSDSKSISLSVVTPPNEAPTATITSPKEGWEIPSGSRTTLAGTVDDLEDDPTLLTARFVSDQTGALSDWLTPNASGQVSVTASLEDGPHTLELVVQDTQGLEGVSAPVHVTVTVNNPPEVEFEEQEQTFFNEGETVTLTAYATDDATAPGDLELEWTSSQDGPLSCTASADAYGKVTCSFKSLSPGDHDIRLTATDGGGRSGDAQTQITINGIPSAPSVAILPAEPRTEDDLVAEIEAQASDPDGDAITYKYAWRRSNQLMTDLVDAEVPSKYTKKGERWTVEVTPNDGFVDGPAASANVTIVNTPPELSTVGIAPTQGDSSTEFFCLPDGYQDVDGDPEGYLYEWLADGVVIDGAVASSHVATGLSHEQRLRCRATPTDGEDEGTPLESNDAIIQGRAPSVESVAIAPSSGGEETKFTCVPSGWSDPDGEEPGYTYQWYVNGVKGPVSSEITGVSFNKHNTIRCEVTPFDGYLSGEPVQSATLTIANTPPKEAGLSVEIVPVPAYANSHLQCQTKGFQDVDGDQEQSEFTWYINGVDIETERSVSLDHALKRGDKVDCTAHVSDGESDPIVLTAAQVTISNSPPTITGVDIDPPFGSDRTSFTAIPKGANDIDGDEVSYRYQWYVNGITSVTVATISDELLEINDTIYVEVSPYDGIVAGTTKKSTTITVGAKNNPPRIEEVTLTPTEAYEGSVLTCSALGATDPEGDQIGYTYEWYKTSVLISGATGNTLNGNNFNKRDTIECIVTPDDGQLSGSPITSNQVVILNTVPGEYTAAITPTSPTKASTLKCNMTGPLDADGDELEFFFEWYVNGTLQTLATTENLDNSYFSAGDTVYCKGTPYDGEARGPKVTSGTVTIIGTPPEIGSVELTPTTAYESSELVCTAKNVHDEDGDTVTLAYAWYKNTKKISGVASTVQRLTGEYFNEGDLMQCEVTPSAAGQTGTAKRSNTVTILNSLPTIERVALGPDPAYVTDELKCTAVNPQDIDGETPSLAYTWKVGSSSYPNEGATLKNAPGRQLFGRGDTVQCVVTPSDAAGAGAPVPSNSLKISNSPPSLEQVQLSPDPAYTDSVLICAASGEQDADGDTVSLSYRWIKGQTTISGAVNPTLSGSFFSRGDVITCEVTPADDVSTGTAVKSNAVEISNSLPTIASVSITPTLAYETSTLKCAANGVEDKDDDTVSVAYAWSVNDRIVSGATSQQLNGTYFNHDDEVTCTATPSDPFGAGNTVASNAITIANSAPAVESATLTASPSPAREDSVLTCAGVGPSDPDDDDVQYLYIWTVADVVLSEERGETLTGASFNKGDVVSCTVIPYDGSLTGPSQISNALTILNSSPTVDGVTLGPDPATKTSTMSCTYTSTEDIDGDSVGVLYQWTVNDKVVTGQTSATLAPSYFKKDEHVQCYITPTDGFDPGDPVGSNVVTIRNSAPTITSVAISPAFAFEKTTLTCEVKGKNDVDGDGIVIHYAWSVDDSTVSGANTETLNGTFFDKGQSVTCTATPDDGNVRGTSMTSAPLVISNTAPVIVGALLTSDPEPATESSTLTCIADGVDDDDDDTVLLIFQWTVSEEVVHEEIVSDGFSSTLDGNFFDKHDEVVCTITPNDGEIDGTEAVSDPVTILNTLPTVGDVSLDPVPAMVTDTLTCLYTDPSDADQDTVTPTYRWKVNGTQVSGATQSTLSLSPYRKGNTVQCSVTPSDGDGNGTTEYSDILTISNSPPSIGTVALTPVEAYEKTTLTCGVSSRSDADTGDTVTLKYSWAVGGQTVQNETGPTLNGDLFDKGDLVTCTVTPYDGTVNGGAKTSAPVEILNTAPEVVDVTLGPAEPYVDSELICSATTADDDDETVDVLYQWEVDDVLLEDESSATLSGAFAKDQVVRCSATPVDSEVEGETVYSDPVTILNTPPSIGGVTLGPLPATVTSQLTCSYTSPEDIDPGDSVTPIYNWFVNGSIVTSATSSTLDLSPYHKGNTVRCRVTPFDGDDNGAPVSSTTVTIANSPPSISSVAVDPTDPYETSTLHCVVSASDPDGETPGVTYTWTVGGSLVSAVTSAPLTGTYFGRGDSVTCTATPDDGTDVGSPATSDPVEILNSAPEVSDVAIEPSVGHADSTLTCSADVSDVDDHDTAEPLYTWFVNGDTVEGADGDTLSGVFSKGDTVKCSVTPTDGTLEGDALQSAPVAIVNTAPTTDKPTLSPSNPKEGTTITCTPGHTEDIDGDSAGFDFAWYVNDEVVSGADGTSLTSAYFDKDDSVVCEVTPKDSQDSGDPVVSDPVVVLNTAPTLSSVTLTPNPAYRASTMVCTPVGYNDVDGDPAQNYTYAWFVAEVEVPNATSATLANQFQKGETVQCQATPFDGEEYGDSVLSNVITISNTPPPQPSVAISPSMAYDGDALEALASCTDPDGDTVTFSYAWTVDPGGATSYVTKDVPGGVIVGGEVWTVRVTPWDGEDYGAWAEASVSVLTDSDGDGVAVQQDDCDDDDETIYPFAAEVLDGKDNDCNDVIDDRWENTYSYGETTDGWPDIGIYPTLGIESDGLTHLYFSGLTPSATGSTLYTVFDSVTESFEDVQNLDTATDARYNRVSLWPRTSQPTQVRTAFFDATANRIQFKNFTGTAWEAKTTPTLPSSAGPNGLAMVTSSSGTDYLLYTGSDGRVGCPASAWETKLVMASRASGVGSFTLLSTPISTGCGTAGTLVIESPSMAIGADSVLHVSWYADSATNSGDLRYRRVIPSGTSSAVIDAVTTNDVGAFNSVAVIPGQNPSYPHIAYYDATNSEIRLASTTNLTTLAFTTVLVANASTLGGSIPAAAPVVLRYDGDGYAHILFEAGTGPELWYSTNESGAWVAEEVVTSTGASLVNNHCDMVVDADSNPRILCQNPTDEDVYLWKGKLHTTVLPF